MPIYYFYNLFTLLSTLSTVGLMPDLILICIVVISLCGIVIDDLLVLDSFFYSDSPSPVLFRHFTMLWLGCFDNSTEAIMGVWNLWSDFGGVCAIAQFNYQINVPQVLLVNLDVVVGFLVGIFTLLGNLVCILRAYGDWGFDSDVHIIDIFLQLSNLHFLLSFVFASPRMGHLSWIVAHNKF